MRLLISQINPTVGALKDNSTRIIAAIEHARKQKAQLVVFPELCLCGYPPKDLLEIPSFTLAIEKELDRIVAASYGISVVLGTVRQNSKAKMLSLFNTAAIISDAKILGYQDKCLLPTYDVFDEHRYFKPGEKSQLWNLAGLKIAITICEDMWHHAGKYLCRHYSLDPIFEIKKLNPDLMLNLAASPYHLKKVHTRINVCAASAKTLNCPVILCNQVGGNDSLIFDGYSLYLNAEGHLVQHAKGFEEDQFFVDLTLKTPSKALFYSSEEELYRALVLGLQDYFHKSGFTKCCLGLSGGIDSALVACIAVEALGKSNVLGVLMPSRYSSEGSTLDATKLVENLGIDSKTISIENPFETYLNLLGRHFAGTKAGTTEENLQARIRGMLLMSLSNKFGHIVLSTGNKSEMALGYSTLYGDLCGGLGVISDVYKHQVYALSHWINRNALVIPQNTLTKAPSAELRPNQKDSDSLPDYDIIDHVLKAYVEKHLDPATIAQKYHYNLAVVEDLVHKIHQNEYKRRQSPPGLRVTEKAFSTGRHFPIVQKWKH